MPDLYVKVMLAKETTGSWQGKIMNIKKRNPALVLIFSFLTLGIYAIYWSVKTKNEIKSLGADIPTAFLIVIPLANLYFWYKYADGFANYVKRDDKTILYFLLGLFLPPIAVIVYQVELNKLAK